jgi:hypothetical protein
VWRHFHCFWSARTDSNDTTSRNRQSVPTIENGAGGDRLWRCRRGDTKHSNWSPHSHYSEARNTRLQATPNHACWGTIRSVFICEARSNVDPVALSPSADFAIDDFPDSQGRIWQPLASWRREHLPRAKWCYQQGNPFRMPTLSG